MDAIKTVLKNQYRALLTMSRQVIDKTPDDVWLSNVYPNRYWQIAFHAVFFTHLYSSVDEKSFSPWEEHRENYQFLGVLPWPPHEKPVIGEPYTQSEVISYVDFCAQNIHEWVDKLDLNAPECGFWWYKMNKLEHQMNNLRHTQHHIGQLADRLRNAQDVGVDWIGGKGSSSAN